MLAKLGLVGDLPACTDLTTKPWVIEAGVKVIDAPFIAHGNVATAGGCFASQYLATWMIARGASMRDAEEAMHYVAPAGESFYEHYYNVDGFENQDVAGLTGRLEWKMPIGTLTSISAYRFNKFNRVQDQDGTIAQAYELDSFERDKTFSQELRLSNQTEKLNWVTGVYYYNDRTDRQDKVITGPDYGPAALRNLTSIDHSRLHVESIALFGQASYYFTRRLSLTAGGRWTQDKKRDDRFVQRFTTPAYTVDPEARTTNSRCAPNIPTSRRASSMRRTRRATDFIGRVSAC